jgi:deoxyuridine 5'-triphosphate nucleotidohydrolase
VNKAKTFYIGTQNNQPLKILKLMENAKTPTKATQESIGYDIYAVKDTQIPQNGNQLVETGLAMTPPKGSYIRIAPRSGLALRNKIQIDAGVIYPDYTGEIKVLLSNRSTKPFQVSKGDKIAQVILEKAESAPIQVVDSLKSTNRGDKGFGSSGNGEITQGQAHTNKSDITQETGICYNNKQVSTSNKLIIMPKIMERPPGCSFIGTSPTSANVRLGDTKGPVVKVIIDSGLDITLISQETLQKMPKPPKQHQGKQVKLSQVTSKITISGYVDLPLIFETSQGPVQTDVEAYIVKGMTTPLILGNDFADQYSLSIIRNEGESTLKFANTGRSVRLENSTTDTHLSPEVKTFLTQVKKGRHQLRYKERQREVRNKANPHFVSEKEETIAPFSSRRITYKILGKDSGNSYLLEPKELTGSKLALLQLTDAIVNKLEGEIVAFNPGDTPITLKQGESLGKVVELSCLDEDPSPETVEGINCFINFTKTFVKSHNKKLQGQSKEEKDYAENQGELPVGPKTAEVPEFEDIPREQLISALDINPKLSRDQKSKLEKVLNSNHKAFSLDGRIGKYEGIKYEIKVQDGATPISLPPYSASPDKREAIDKQLDKWFSQDVIEPSDSPWGAPVIVVYRFGKPRVCIDYRKVRKVNQVSQADEYPLPKQTDILQALMGSQWLSTFDALSGFQQVEVKEEHRHITAFRCHRGLLQFKRLPFGLRNGPQVFQRIMNRVLSTMLWLFVLVYIDDIVVYSKTFEDHLGHLDKVLKAIIGANITLSPPM